MESHFGGAVALGANLLLITSVFAALLSFHNGVARYVYSLARERVLLPALGRTGRGSSAPVGGSAVQSVLALVVICACAILRLDPFTQLFTWLSYVAAVGVLLLMFGTSVAVVGFFRTRRGGRETLWQRAIAPALAAVALAAVTWVTIQNSATLLGAQRSSPLVWILPGLVFAAAALGLLWGLVLKAYSPAVYRGIGSAGSVSPVAGNADGRASYGVTRHRRPSVVSW